MTTKRQRRLRGADRVIAWIVIVVGANVLCSLFVIDNVATVPAIVLKLLTACLVGALLDRLYPLAFFSKSTLTKTTVLDGHYASADYECFVFDRHRGPEEHSATYRAWLRTNPNPSEDPPDDVMDESCRVYPGALIPKGSDRRKGRWTITIEFEPVDGE